MIRTKKGNTEFSGTILELDKDIVHILRAYKEMFEEHMEELSIESAKEHLAFLLDTAFKTEEEIEAEVKGKMQSEEVNEAIDDVINDIENDENLPSEAKKFLLGIGKLIKEIGCD